MTTDSLDRYIQEYASSHRNPSNEIIHCLCVPAILFAVIGALRSGGMVLVLAAIAILIVYYIRFSLRAAAEMACLLFAMLAIWLGMMPAHHIFLYAVGIFVVAWIGQFIGHAIEGAKPSFFKDMQFLLIGPLYVLAVLTGRLHGGKQPTTP